MTEIAARVAPAVVNIVFMNFVNICLCYLAATWDSEN